MNTETSVMRQDAHKWIIYGSSSSAHADDENFPVFKLNLIYGLSLPAYVYIAHVSYTAVYNIHARGLFPRSYTSLASLHPPLLRAYPVYMRNINHNRHNAAHIRSVHVLDAHMRIHGGQNVHDVQRGDNAFARTHAQLLSNASDCLLQRSTDPWTSCQPVVPLHFYIYI